MNKKILIGAVVLCCCVVGYMGTLFAGTTPTMTKEALKAKLGSADVVIIDVRAGKDWKSSELKIKGAVREAPKDVSWMQKYAKGKTIVLYCA